MSSWYSCCLPINIHYPPKKQKNIERIIADIAPHKTFPTNLSCIQSQSRIIASKKYEIVTVWVYGSRTSLSTQNLSFLNNSKNIYRNYRNLSFPLLSHKRVSYLNKLEFWNWKQIYRFLLNDENCFISIWYIHRMYSSPPHHYFWKKDEQWMNVWQGSTPKELIFCRDGVRKEILGIVSFLKWL